MGKLLSKSKLIYRFLLSYLIIMLIPLLISIIVYQESLAIIEKTAYDKNLYILENSVDIIDKKLSEVESIVMNLIFSSEVNNYLKLDNPYQDLTVLCDVIDFQKSISNFRISDRFITMIHIHSYRSNTIISPYTSYLNMDLFYGKLFSYDGMDYEEWQAFINDRWYSREIFPAKPIMLNKNEFNAISYVQSMPISRIGTKKGDVIVYIKEDELISLLNNLSSNHKGWFYIEDTKGQIISKVSSFDDYFERISFSDSDEKGYLTKQMLGKSMFITYTTSSLTGWRYVSATPMNIINEIADSLKRFIYLFATASIIIGLFLSYLLAYRNSKPISELINLLRGRVKQDSNNDKDSYDSLKNSIYNLIHNSEELKVEIKSHIPFLRFTFFHHLLNGEYQTKNEALADLQKAGVNTNARRFIVLIVSINECNQTDADSIIEELHMIKLLIKNILINRFNIANNWCDIDLDKIMVLLPFISQDLEKNIAYAESLAKSTYDMIKNDYNANISFVGSIADDLLNVSRAYYEARRALSYKDITGNKKVNWYRGDTSGESSEYYYPIEMELKLISYIKNGDISSIDSYMQILYKENIIKRKIPLGMLRQLVFSLQGTLLRALEETVLNKEQLINMTVNIANEIIFESETDKKDFFTLASNQFINICNKFSDELFSDYNQLKDQLAEYIDSNHSDSGLCLASVADHFGLTESFLSKFFRKHFEISFSRYVENIRMKYACELMLETELPLADIAMMVGYNSSHSFRRAYKRIYGHNPSEFKPDSSH